MDWYYAEAGRQIGPVADGPFEELVRIGKVTSETMVWHEGMANWQVFRTVRPSAAPGIAPPPPPPPGVLMESAPGFAPPVISTGATCAECGYLFPQSEMIAYEGVWVCARCKPIFFQRVREGAPMAPGAASAWQSGDAVVLTVGGAFPFRCVKCNGAAEGALVKRSLYWHQPWVYVLLVSPIIYIIVSLLMRKTAKVEVPLCHEDRARWVKWITISWVTGLAGLMALIIGIANDLWVLGLLGFAAFLTGLILGPVKATLVSSKKIDRDYVWVRGTCREYRESLPNFNQ